MDKYQALNSTIKSEIENALYSIGEEKPTNAIELILPFLDHDDVEIRETAAFNLGEIHIDGAIEPLIYVVQADENDSVKFFALSALKEYQSPKIESLIFKLLDSKTLPLRIKRVLIELLKKYPSIKARDILMEILLRHTDDHNISIPAIDSLYVMKQDMLKEMWGKIIDSTAEEYVAMIAQKAIIEAEYKGSKHKFNPKVFDELNEEETLYELFRITVEISDEVEKFLLESLRNKRFDDLFAYGAVTMNLLIAMIIIEKGTINSTKKVAQLLPDVWSSYQIERLQNMLEGTPLIERYQSALSK
jgi:HEAT repeat protein